MISWITRYVGIGELSDILNPELLKKERVFVIINLTKFKHNHLEMMFFKRHGKKLRNNVYCHYRHYPIITNPDKNMAKFQEECEMAYYGITRWRFSDPNERILVNCVAGMDRSPFVMALYLVKEKMAQNLSEAYIMIKKKRPQIIEHYEWWHPIWGAKE